mgnify:CR=1 FL=1
MLKYQIRTAACKSTTGGKPCYLALQSLQVLYGWFGVALLVVISVGAAGILIARKNPKDIFSEIS